jgi:transcription factor TFIIIB component B''
VFKPKLKPRRRDHAPAATATTSTSTPTPTPAPTSSVEPQSLPTPDESQPLLTPEEPQPLPTPDKPQPLLTPVATQDSAPQEATQPAAATTEPSPVELPQPTNVSSPPITQSTSVAADQATSSLVPQSEPETQELSRLPSPQNTTVPASSIAQNDTAGDDVETRVEEAATSETVAVEQPSAREPALPEDTAAPAVPAGPNNITEDNAETRAGEAAASEAATEERPSARESPPRRRRLPWVAVNRPRDTVDGAATTARPTRAGRKRKAAAAPRTEEQEETGPEDGTETITRPKTKPKPNPRVAKGRGRKAAAADADTAVAPTGDGTAVPPAKKPRKTRKDKGVTRNRPDGPEEHEGGEGEDGTVSGARKRRKNGRRPAGAPERQEGDQPAHPRGRQKETTPSDAEDNKIDETNTFMDRIASRNIRVGRMSTRERKMRDINWDEVKERRRAEETVAVTRMEDRAELEKRLAAAGEDRDALFPEQEEPPSRQVEFANGTIRIVAGANNVDREAQADREYEQMETVEEDDLTNRITVRSFLRNNKRFPKDFVLPGRGKQWSAEATEDFYSALQMFGTDFGMIATMFPGTPRASIKGKFTREERDNPERIKEVLNGDRNLDWDEYLRRSNTKNENYVDADAIKRDLDVERARMEVEIEAARVAHAEELRQQAIAGARGDANKENGKKKGKKGDTAQTKTAAVAGREVEVDEIDEEWLNA